MRLATIFVLSFSLVTANSSAGPLPVEARPPVVRLPPPSEAPRSELPPPAPSSDDGTIVIDSFKQGGGSSSLGGTPDPPAAFVDPFLRYTEEDTDAFVNSQISARDTAIRTDSLGQMSGAFNANDASQTAYRYYTIFERLFPPDVRLGRLVPPSDRQFGDTDDVDIDCIPAAVSIISTVPRNPEEYKQVFGREPTATNEDEMRNAEHEFRVMDPDTNFDITSSEVFASSFDKIRSPFIVIVGHNDGGNIITKHNGMVNINGANELCYSRLKLCLFISCYSAKYLNNDFGYIGLKDAISIKKAVNVTKRAIVDTITNTMFQGSGCLDNPFRTVQHLEALFPEPWGYVAYIKTGGAITGGVILVTSLIADSDR